MNPDGETWGGLPVVRQLSCAQPRSRVMVSGLVTATGAGAVGNLRAYLCRLEDGTGGITLAFTGRTSVAGLETGCLCRIEGTARESEGQLVVFNPDYEFLPAAHPSRQDRDQ